MKKIKLERASETQLESGQLASPPLSPAEPEQEHELNLSSSQTAAEAAQTEAQANQQASQNNAQSNAQNNGQNNNNSNSQTVQQQPAANTPPNFCNICNKELCNKYFMKTHMQKMHGINLGEGGSGVMCDICQKMLCSKYFLKVHKSNTHGVTDFSSQHSAGSQAAIALANTLTNAQKCAALNLALNQHQLQQQQSRVQAAALMNATTFSPLTQLSAANVAALQQQPNNQQQPHPNNQQQQQQQFHQQQQHQFSQALNLNNPIQRLQQHQPELRNATSRLGAHESDDDDDGQEASDHEHHATPPMHQPLLDDSRALGDLELQQQLQSRQAFLQALARNPAAAAMLAAVAQGSNGANVNPAQMALGQTVNLANLAASAQNPNLAGAAANGLPALGNFQAAMAAAAAAGLNQQAGQPQAQQPQARNNNNNNNSQTTNSTTSSNQQNSRYLRHYTEACNICDRRFKSIKWLQSHVMNDHKNEIENLFGILVQLLICGMSGANQPQPQAGVANNNASQPVPLATSLAGGGQALLQNGQQQVAGLMQATQQQQQLESANLCNSPKQNFLASFPAGLLLPQPQVAAGAAARQRQQPQVNPIAAAACQAAALQLDGAPLGQPPVGLTGTLASLIGLQQQIQSMQQQQLLVDQQPASTAPVATAQRRRVGGQRTRRAQTGSCAGNQQASQRRRFSPVLLAAAAAAAAANQQQQQQQQPQQHEQQEQPLALTTTPTSLQSPSNRTGSPASSRGPTPASSVGSLATPAASQLVSRGSSFAGKLASGEQDPEDDLEAGDRSPASSDSVSPPVSPAPPHANQHAPNSHHHSPIGLLFENLNRNH